MDTSMSLSLESYREKLTHKILSASSQEQTGRYIDTAIKALEKYKLNGHIVTRFVEKTIDKLESFNPMNKDAQQWSNIQTARVLLGRIKNQMKSSAN
jgi:hypothetical protein